MTRVICFTAVALVSALCLTSGAGAADADVSALGDLSAFKAHADAALKAVNDDDMKTAKGKMKDLETAWDAAEPDLKKKSSAAWGTVDKTIDKALAAVRAAKPDAAKCKETIQAVIDVCTPVKK